MKKLDLRKHFSCIDFGVFYKKRQNNCSILQRERKSSKDRRQTTGKAKQNRYLSQYHIHKITLIHIFLGEL